MNEHHWGLIEFPRRIGEKGMGELVPAEAATGVPFPIARTYWIHHWDRGRLRGGHAHRRIQQIFFCLQGRVDLTVRFGDEVMGSYCLQEPHIGLWTGPLVWLTMTPRSHDTILLVLASGRHDEGEYIRTWEEYLLLAGARAPTSRLAPVGAA